MAMPPKDRKPGRPRAIPPEVEPVVVELYKLGYGYRAIARILNGEEYGVRTHFSSVRKALIRLDRVVPGNESPHMQQVNTS
ncbi:hypothetical protein ACFLU4_05040 [Chloroflexota bacterium]